jgi:hypothetical protein
MEGANFSVWNDLLIPVTEGEVIDVDTVCMAFCLKHLLWQAVCCLITWRYECCSHSQELVLM